MNGISCTDEIEDLDKPCQDWQLKNNNQTGILFNILVVVSQKKKTNKFDSFNSGASSVGMHYIYTYILPCKQFNDQRNMNFLTMTEMGYE